MERKSELKLIELNVEIKHVNLTLKELKEQVEKLNESVLNFKNIINDQKNLIFRINEETNIYKKKLKNLEEFYNFFNFIIKYNKIIIFIIGGLGASNLIIFLKEIIKIMGVF